MAEDRNDSEYLRALAAQFCDDAVTLIDFDDARNRLDEMAGRLEDEHSLAEDHALLRKDYQRRIAGMIKAIAAVERKSDRWEEAADLIDELPSLTAEQLVQTYRKVAARFRDRFPTSYGPAGGSSRTLPAGAAHLFN